MPIPDELRRFLVGARLRVPHVETLLLLRGARGESWDAARLAARLYVDDKRAERVLAALAKLGLVRGGHGAYRYEPRDATLAALVDTLERVYSTQLVEVAALLHSLDDPAARAFADAFRIGKQEDDR